MERQQVIMAVVAFVMALYLLLSGHLDGNVSVGVARSVSKEPSGWLKISGDVHFPGVYPTGVNGVTPEVILLAKPLCAIPLPFDNPLASPGSDLHISCLSAGGVATLTTTPMSVSERLVLNIPIDLNRATVADLEKIPGIGPVMAERIVAFRQKNGGFGRLEELEMVQGIGNKKLAHLSKYLQLTDTKGKY